MRGYRAVVELTPTVAGTGIAWSAPWDATPAGPVVRRSLPALLPRIVRGLAEAAESADGGPGGGAPRP